MHPFVIYPCTQTSASKQNTSTKPLQQRAALVEFVQIFARLEADSLAGCDADFGSGTWIAPDTCFAGADVENSKAAQLDAVTRCEGLLKAFKDSFDGGLGFHAGQSGTLNYLVYDVLLNQWLSPETQT